MCLPTLMYSWYVLDLSINLKVLKMFQSYKKLSSNKIRTRTYLKKPTQVMFFIGLVKLDSIELFSPMSYCMPL